MFDVLNSRLDGLQDRIDRLHKDLSESVDRIALMYERNGRLERERDAALSAMWGMICVATGLQSSRRAITHALSETAQELNRLRASVSLQARDGH